MDLALYRDLESYHAWAMGKLLSLCATLSNAELDAPRPLGLGSLRATLKHIAAAEQIWLDRWQGKPTSGLPDTPDSIDRLSSLYIALAKQRQELIESIANPFEAKIRYRNLKGAEFSHALGDLILHVLNHGIHHRAQAIHFLKHSGITIAGGLDYIFYRIAHPTILLEENVVQNSRAYGLEVGEKLVSFQSPSVSSLLRYTRYSDWATQLILSQCLKLTDEELDREWGMGVGGIRKSLVHLYHAEMFWQSNWTQAGSPFPNKPTAPAINELCELWTTMSAKRNESMRSKGDSGLGDKVTVDFGGGPLVFRFSESVLQLAVHGTWHRAQINNMLRLTGAPHEAIDYVIWLRDAGE